MDVLTTLFVVKVETSIHQQTYFLCASLGFCLITHVPTLDLKPTIILLDTLYKDSSTPIQAALAISVIVLPSLKLKTKKNSF